MNLFQLESSSVFRSALTPLVGIGVLTLERLFPLILGSNIGTTSTGILAALSSDPSKLQSTLQMALSQTYYNVFGAILFHPIPFMRRLPIKLAMKLGDTTAKVSYIAIHYYIAKIKLFSFSTDGSLLFIYSRCSLVCQRFYLAFLFFHLQQCSVLLESL